MREDKDLVCVIVCVCLAHMWCIHGSSQCGLISHREDVRVEKGRSCLPAGRRGSGYPLCDGVCVCVCVWWCVCVCVCKLFTFYVTLWCAFVFVTLFSMHSMDVVLSLKISYRCYIAYIKSISVGVWGCWRGRGLRARFSLLVKATCLAYHTYCRKQNILGHIHPLGFKFVNGF